MVADDGAPHREALQALLDEARLSGESQSAQRRHHLGHKTATMTLDRYGHLFPDDLDAVADAFDSAADALRTATALRSVAAHENSL